MKFKFYAIMAFAIIASLASCNCKSGNCDTKTTTDKTVNQVSKEQSKTITAMKPIALTKEEFLTKVMNYEQNPTEWKYLGDKPCLIDFYASWCGPCKMLSPILDQLAEEYGDSIYIYKVNTETEQELASAFGIRSIPSLLFVPMDGKPQMSQGAMPKQSLKEAIDKVLLNK